MSRGGHDVGGHQRPLHHPRVQLRVIAARVPVSGKHAVVGGQEEGAGSTREVTDSQVLNGGGFRPIHIETRHRELGQQSGRIGQRIESGEELPIRNQALKHAAGQVIEAVGADGRKLVRHVGQAIHDVQHRRVADGQQQIHGDLEDRPVVDPQYAPPALQEARPKYVAGFAAQAVQMRYAMLTRQRRVERHRVRNDRHRHARCLLAVLLVEKPSDLVEASRGCCCRVRSEDVGSLPNSLL